MDKQTAKLVARIAENLPDINHVVIQKWIDNPKGLQSFLQELCTPVKYLTKHWFTVRLGTGLKTDQDFEKAMKDAGCDRDTDAFRILLELGQTYDVSRKPVDVDLVIATPRDLGIDDSRLLQKIYSKAQNAGLKICPAEVGPQLCLQYRKKFPGELFIGMQPVLNSSGNSKLFYVCTENEQHLGATDAGVFFEPDWKFVFVAPATSEH